MNPQRYNQFIRILSINKQHIIHLLQDSWSNINLSNMEPKIILDYLKDGINYLNRKLSPILSQNGFISKFAGVFIHQKPR